MWELIWCNSVNFGDSKATRTTNKNIVWLREHFKVTFFFNIKITTYWINLGQPELACQICDPGYENIITL